MDFHLSVDLAGSEGHVQHSETGTSFIEFTLLTRVRHGDRQWPMLEVDDYIDLTLNDDGDSSSVAGTDSDFHSPSPSSRLSSGTPVIVPVCTRRHPMYREINALAGSSRSNDAGSSATALGSPTCPQSGPFRSMRSMHKKHVSCNSNTTISVLTHVVQASSNDRLTPERPQRELRCRAKRLSYKL
jgi:hypothetical protein